MASVHRRRQHHYNQSSSSSSSSSSSLAARAISASSAHIDSSLSSAYYTSSTTTTATATTAATVPSESNSGFGSKYNPNSNSNSNTVKSSRSNEEGKNGGFWGNLARKAKSILEDTTDLENSPKSTPATTTQSQQPTPTLQKGLGAIASSFTYIGNAVEEGLSIVENRTADIIQETRKHIRKKPTGFRAKNEQGSFPQSQTVDNAQSEQEIQLKASRDVAMAMAAKAKVLLRELKTVKADLAFAKERCAQLEEENKYLRETRERGGGPDDDDLIRLQLESLLAEKARLAHENSIYARENRFLREVVEYHQLTMQDVIYLDESAEEVSEVYPSKVPLVSNVPADSASESLPYPISPLSSTSQHKTEGSSSQPVPSLNFAGVAAGRRLQ